MKKIKNVLSLVFASLFISSIAFAVGIVNPPPTGQNQTALSIGGRIDDGTRIMVPAKITANGEFYFVTGTPRVETVRSMDAFGSVGVGTPVNVSGAEDIYATVSCSTVGCDKDLAFQCSWRETPLLAQGDFLGSAGSLANPWSYVSFYDMQDPTTLITSFQGSFYNWTGDVTKTFLINVDGCTQVTPRIVLNSVAGNVTVDITYYVGN